MSLKDEVRWTRRIDLMTHNHIMGSAFEDAAVLPVEALRARLEELKLNPTDQ